MKCILFYLIEDRSSVVKGQRHTWSTEENAAIERFFNSHINDTSKTGNKGKLHGKLCMQFQKKQKETKYMLYKLII